MATTNETMKVIAEGIDQKKSPDIIMDGRVIVTVEQGNIVSSKQQIQNSGA